MQSTKIIVGVDGSAGANAAALWAATEAMRRGVDLVAMHVYDWRVIGARTQVGGPLADDARIQAESVVETTIQDVRSAVPDVRVHGEAVLGAVVPTLVHASEQAGLVVVGSRGRGGFASLLLGSVGQQVATHAASPVAVVRGRPGAVDGPVVVGTDGSDTAQRAVGVAFDEAATRSTSVLAVRAYTPSLPIWNAYTPSYVEDREERQAAEYEALRADIEPWADKYPGVAWAGTATDRIPADALVDASSTAQLVVVGTRGRGGFTGLLLGSVSLHVLHHAASPVLISRANQESAE